MEITGAYSGTITFAGSSGTLTIDNSASFSGKIAGQLAIGDVIDLADITAGANATIGYSGNNSPGTLTLSDGTNTASIALLGNYSLANFTASSDGFGGTSVVDPPLPTGQSGNMPSENQAMDPVESALNQQLALWSQHMASAFPSSAFSNGGPSLVSPSEFGRWSAITIGSAGRKPAACLNGGLIPSSEIAEQHQRRLANRGMA